MTDSGGNIVWQADYRPFGEANVHTETIVNNLRFPGQYYDAESGLHYNYFRDYDPGIGRYVESDPIGLLGGINTYAYVDGNPLRWIDFFGLRPCPPGMVPAGTPCWISDENGDTGYPNEGGCETGECAAGLLPAEPDIRSASQIECDQCKFVCALSVTVGTPLPTNTFNAAVSGGGSLLGRGACEIVCHSECWKANQCNVNE